MKRRINYENLTRRLILSLVFSFFVFIILLITSLLLGLLVYLAAKNGLLEQPAKKGPFSLLFLFMLISIIVGTIVSFFFGHFPLRPVNKIIDATNRLSKGDFSTRLNLRHPSPFYDLSLSFNKMAEELGTIELLRSDFINNFSHEFKTPIVSIKGFVEILKYADLTYEEQQEYLDIIISEADRLSSLSTSVLNLSHVEKQTILHQTVSYNLAEQIRKCIVLLQNQWESKNLIINADFDDVTILGNEEMLNQVWVNLLNNAIKFSPKDSELTITITISEQQIEITIHNWGTPIPPDALPHIFNKFYQVDTTHTTPGNGLGLTIVKKIVELHKGVVTCSSSECGTSFTVTIPN